MLIWGISNSLGQDSSQRITLPITLNTYNKGFLQRYAATMNFTPSIQIISNTQIEITTCGNGINPPCKVQYLLLSI